MATRRTGILAALAATMAALLVTALLVSATASAAPTPTAVFSKDSGWAATNHIGLLAFSQVSGAD